MPRKPTTKTLLAGDGSKTVHNKNANGQGTLYFQESHNSWRASYVLEGETKRRVVQARTREAVALKRDRAIAEGAKRRAGPTRFGTGTTVAEFASWWVDNELRHRVRGSSLDKARDRIVRLGDLRNIPIAAITTEGLISWQSELLDRYSPSTVSDTRVTIRQLFDRAVELGLISNSPASRLRPPRVRRQPGRTLTTGEVSKLLDAAEAQRYGPVVHLLFTSGLRVSEALGLSWDDLDLESGTAIVRRAVAYSKTHGTALGPPKTEGAGGLHHLAPGAVQRLGRWRTKQTAERLSAGPLWQKQIYEGVVLDLVFTTEIGGLVSRQHIDTLLRRSARKVDIDTQHLGTHVGRRTVVTTLYANGAELTDIARHVGHASTVTTAGYVAAFGERPQRTAQLAASLLDHPASPADTPG